MASIPQLLLNILMELVDQELKTFQWHLYQKGSAHIPKSKIKDVDKPETVDVLVQTFGEEGAVTVTLDTLSAMHFNDLRETLKEKYSNGKVDLKTRKDCEIE